MKKACVLVAAALFTFPALADDALGTLTVRGRTVILKEVAAAEQSEPGKPSKKWLVILASDKKVAPEDRSIERLSELAHDGKIHAVRILWLVGTDTVRAVPYDRALDESGKMGSDRPTLDLKRYGSGRLEAEFKSKMLGQDWHFHANVKADVAKGGVVEIEPESEESVQESADPKITLGKMGYEYNEEAFYHAVGDGNLDAVRLFLKIGMSPNAHKEDDQHAMLFAAQLCANDPEEKHRSAILEALVAAGGNVKAKDQNSSTPLLWAVQTGCAPSAIRALLKAGADPNAKAKGGATPLMFAEIFKRTEIEKMLKQAGAHK
jgi:hypothetical protein